MNEGTVKSVRVDKGFGFIAEPNSPDIFFHLSALEEGLTLDESLVERRVRYSVVSTPRGPKAVCVQPAE